MHLFCNLRQNPDNITAQVSQGYKLTEPLVTPVISKSICNISYHVKVSSLTTTQTPIDEDQVPNSSSSMPASPCQFNCGITTSCISTISASPWACDHRLSVTPDPSCSIQNCKKIKKKKNV